MVHCTSRQFYFFLFLNFDWCIIKVIIKDKILHKSLLTCLKLSNKWNLRSWHGTKLKSTQDVHLCNKTTPLSVKKLELVIFSNSLLEGFMQLILTIQSCPTTIVLRIMNTHLKIPRSVHWRINSFQLLLLILQY